MSWIEALILGLLQGLTEFLPVSSSGHLELGGAVFGLQNPDTFFTFNILVHGATFMSVVVVFRKDIRDLIVNLFRFRWNAETRFVLLLVASAIPVGIVGLLFEEKVEMLFQGRIVLVGVMLLVTAVVLFLTRFAPKKEKEVNLKSALLIGLAQTVAVMPGISRSGATISTALYLGIERGKAIRFSFLMVLIPIFGANFLKILKMSDNASLVPTDTLPLVVGTLAAFLAGLAACRWMLNIVRKGNIAWFSIYCLIIGLVAIVAGLF
ncbi:MAG: undecaprenyl-diphosphate phosphatase [Bacteroides sp.]|jgi:undecaprenyl-diphosphatase|nr:undecaprenyl-diphosphate phosphatase [Bacteroides sp.]